METWTLAELEAEALKVLAVLPKIKWVRTTNPEGYACCEATWFAKLPDDYEWECGKPYRADTAEEAVQKAQEGWQRFLRTKAETILNYNLDHPSEEEQEKMFQRALQKALRQQEVLRQQEELACGAVRDLQTGRWYFPEEL